MKVISFILLTLIPGCIHFKDDVSSIRRDNVFASHGIYLYDISDEEMKLREECLKYPAPLGFGQITFCANQSTTTITAHIERVIRERDVRERELAEQKKRRVENAERQKQWEEERDRRRAEEKEKEELRREARRIAEEERIRKREAYEQDKVRCQEYIRDNCKKVPDIECEMTTHCAMVGGEKVCDPPKQSCEKVGEKLICTGTPPNTLCSK